MLRTFQRLLAALALLCAAPASTQAADPLASLVLDVPATRIVLRNGLTLIVHEDRSAPLVAVHLWYHVGSRHEPPGKWGYAHLFEHLMFTGSENSKEGFLAATQRIGATDQNGSTNWDRTSYVGSPGTELEFAL